METTTIDNVSDTPYQDAVKCSSFQSSVKLEVNDLVKTCHSLAKEAGWWKYIQHGSLDVMSKDSVCTKLLLIVTEISESTEGLRKDLMDDKLPHRKMFEVELADTLIRLLDLAGATGIDLGGAVAEKLAYNAIREDHKLENRAKEGGKQF